MRKGARVGISPQSWRLWKFERTEHTDEGLSQLVEQNLFAIDRQLVCSPLRGQDNVQKSVSPI
jgi:hypothetical protein